MECNPLQSITLNHQESHLVQPTFQFQKETIPTNKQWHTITTWFHSNDTNYKIALERRNLNQYPPCSVTIVSAILLYNIPQQRFAHIEKKARELLRMSDRRPVSQSCQATLVSQIHTFLYSIAKILFKYLFAS